MTRCDGILESLVELDLNDVSGQALSRGSSSPQWLGHFRPGRLGRYESRNERR